MLGPVEYGDASDIYHKQNRAYDSAINAINKGLYLGPWSFNMTLMMPTTIAINDPTSNQPVIFIMRLLSGLAAYGFVFMMCTIIAELRKLLIADRMFRFCYCICRYK